MNLPTTNSTLSVREFSMLPLQAGMEIKTPDGVGKYEGITSSGIVTVFINGGMKQYSWSECTPIILLRHVLMMEDFVNKWRDQYSTPVTFDQASEPGYSEKGETEWLTDPVRHHNPEVDCWRDVYFNFKDGEGWIAFHERMSKHFTITRKREVK